MPCTKLTEGAALASDSTRSAQRCTDRVRDHQDTRTTPAGWCPGRPWPPGHRRGDRRCIPAAPAPGGAQIALEPSATPADLDLLMAGGHAQIGCPGQVGTATTARPGRKVIDHLVHLIRTAARCDLGAPGCLPGPRLPLRAALALGAGLPGRSSADGGIPEFAAARDQPFKPRHPLGHRRVLGLQDRHPPHAAARSLGQACVLGQADHAPERSALQYISSRPDTPRSHHSPPSMISNGPSPEAAAHHTARLT